MASSTQRRSRAGSCRLESAPAPRHVRPHSIVRDEKASGSVHHRAPLPPLVTQRTFHQDAEAVFDSRATGSISRESTPPGHAQRVSCATPCLNGAAGPMVAMPPAESRCAPWNDAARDNAQQQIVKTVAFIAGADRSVQALEAANVLAAVACARPADRTRQLRCVRSACPGGKAQRDRRRPCHGREAPTTRHVPSSSHGA